MDNHRHDRIRRQSTPVVYGITDNLRCIAFFRSRKGRQREQQERQQVSLFHKTEKPTLAQRSVFHIRTYRAFAVLARGAVTRRSRPTSAPWALVLPFFDEVRKDPRWQDYRGEFGL